MKSNKLQRLRLILMLINNVFHGMESLVNNGSHQRNNDSQSTNNLSEQDILRLNNNFSNKKFMKTFIPIDIFTAKEQILLNENEHKNYYNFFANNNKFLVDLDRLTFDNYVKNNIKNLSIIMDEIIHDYKKKPENFLIKTLYSDIDNDQTLHIFFKHKHKDKILSSMVKTKKVEEDSTDDEDYNENYNTEEYYNKKYSKFVTRLGFALNQMITQHESILLEYIKLKLNDNKVNAGIKQNFLNFINKINDKSSMDEQKSLSIEESIKMATDKIDEYFKKGNKKIDEMNEYIIHKFFHPLDINEIISSIKTIDNQFRWAAANLLRSKENPTEKYWDTFSNGAFKKIGGYNGFLYKHDNVFFLINFRYDEENKQIILEKEFFRDNVTCYNLRKLNYRYCQLHTNDIVNPRQIGRYMDYEQLSTFIQKLLENINNKFGTLDKEKDKIILEQYYEWLKNLKPPYGNSLIKQLYEKSLIKQKKSEIINFLHNLAYKSTEYNYIGYNAGWCSEYLLPIIGKSIQEENIIDTRETNVSNLKTNSISQIIIPDHIFKSIRLNDVSTLWGPEQENLIIKKFLEEIFYEPNQLNKIEQRISKIQENRISSINRFIKKFISILKISALNSNKKQENTVTMLDKIEELIEIINASKEEKKEQFLKEFFNQLNVITIVPVKTATFTWDFREILESLEDISMILENCSCSSNSIKEMKKRLQNLRAQLKSWSSNSIDLNNKKIYHDQFEITFKNGKTFIFADTEKPSDI
jgi:hypothetical protein